MPVGWLCWPTGDCGGIMSGEKDKPGIAIVIAAIGAIATIVTACITGFFGMLPSLVDRVAEARSQQAVSSPTTTLALAAVAPSATAPLPTVTFTLEPTATTTPTLAPSPTDPPTPTPTPLPPLLFASKVAANGQALDPGAAFKGGITELYAVFPAGMAPPGTVLSEENPDDGAYYAFLRPDPDRPITRIGWRWIFEGEVVNEYEMDVTDGSDFWLSSFNYEPGGLFGNQQFPYGTYTVVILLGGNPSASGEVVVEP